MSTTALVTGKLTRKKRSLRTEQHFSRLVTARTQPKGIYTVKRLPHKTSDEGTTGYTSLKSHEVSLPKTYLTRSGSMFLYSDRKYIKEKDRKSPLTNRTDELDVLGQAITRPNTSSSNAKWMQLLGKKQNPPASWSVKRESCRENERYIKSRASDRSRGSETLPYSWNYALAPANQSKRTDIKTVKGLSEAVLAYRKQESSENDTGKYLELIRKKWEGRTDLEKQQLILGGKMYTVSDWTRDWISVHRAYLRESAKQEDTLPAPVPKKSKRTEHKRKHPPKCAWDEGPEKLNRVPTNTPHSRTHREKSSYSRSITIVTV